MALDKQGNFSQQPSELPDVPSPSMTPDQIRAKWQTPLDELKTTMNNAFDKLNSTADGASGADNIGATGFDGTASTPQAMLEDLNTRKAEKGTDWTGTWQGFSPSQVDQTIRDQANTNTSQLADIAINVKNFGAVGDGSSHPLSSKYSTLADAQKDYSFVTSLTQELDWASCQKALNSLSNTPVYSKRVKAPAGTYNFGGDTLIQPADTEIVGDNQQTIFVVNADVEVIASERVDSTNQDGLVIRNIKLHDSRVLDTSGTVTRTKYHLRYTNATRPIIDNVETSVGIQDETNPNTSNISGIFLEKLGNPSSAFCGFIINPWVRYGSVRIDISDSKIFGGYIWAHTSQFGLYLGSNNIRAVSVDVIPSPVYGGVYAPAKVENCYYEGFIDGSYSNITTGKGIYGYFSSCRFHGHIWNCKEEGFYLVDGEANELSIDFYNNNRANNYHADILLKPSKSGEACKGNVFTGCTHQNNQTTSNFGNVFKEDDTNSSGNVHSNVYSLNSCALTANGYASPKISSIRSSQPYQRTVIGPNTNMNTYHSGTQVFASGVTTQTVTHNLGITPFIHEIEVKPSNQIASTKKWYISNITSTTFDIIIDVSDTTTTAEFGWAIKLTA